MRKMFILLVISFVIFINTDTRAFKAKNIDLRLKDNETAIVFLRFKNSNSILVTNRENSNLFILEYKNDKELKEALKIFKVKPNILYLNNNMDKRVDDIYITKHNNIFRFQINNYMLCVYDNIQRGNCDFIYLMHLNKEFFVNENTSVIFYDDEINKKWLKGVQESWVESSIVSSDSFTILKIDEEFYNVIVVPSTKS